MHYRDFGKLGWKVSAIGAGTSALGSIWGTQDDGSLHRDSRHEEPAAGRTQLRCRRPAEDAAED